MPLRFTKAADVPQGRERLVDHLWRFYPAAGRPPMRTIATAIEALDEDSRNATANHETIRRLLRGDAVGNWLTVELVFETLCAMADVDPDYIEPDDDGPWNSQPKSHRDELREAWHLAVDGQFAPVLPRTRAEREASGSCGVRG